ncbi:hypothetical protein B484DRAFT_449078, partial [Ochromonadaceae sp. CCMP2298]
MTPHVCSAAALTDPPIAYCLLPIAYCLLPIAYCPCCSVGSLLTTHCSPLT